MSDERIAALRRIADGKVDAYYHSEWRQVLGEALGLAEQQAERVAELEDDVRLLVIANVALESKASKWEGLRKLDATHVARRLIEAEQERDTLRRERAGR